MTWAVLVNTLLTALQSIVMGIAMMHTIRMKNAKIYLLLSFFIPGVTYYLNVYGNQKWSLLFKIMTLISVMILSFLFAQEKKMYSLLYASCYLTASFLPEIGFALFFNRYLNLMKTNFKVALIGKVCTLVIISGLFYLVWLSLSRKVRSRPLISATHSFYLIPVTQTLMLMQIVPDIEQKKTDVISILTLIITLICCIIADVLFFRAIANMQQNYILRERLHVLEYRNSAQGEYYKRMESSITAANRIRHDINNQLQTAYLIFSSGEPERAKEQLQSLQHTLEREMGSTFCANKVVDAVMMDKFATCRQENFPVDVEIILPDSIPVDGVDLCSIFANLMDNAIHACRGCKDAGIEPWIQIKAHVTAGCLIVRCENSASAVPSNKTPRRNIKSGLSRHGLGLEILRSLSEKYNGDFSAVQNQKSFLVTISLIMAPMQNGTPGAVSHQQERGRVKQTQRVPSNIV